MAISSPVFKHFPKHSINKCFFTLIDLSEGATTDALQVQLISASKNYLHVFFKLYFHQWDH